MATTTNPCLRRGPGRPPAYQVPPDVAELAGRALDALAVLPTATPTVDQLAAAVTAAAAELAHALDALERAELVERWRDGPGPGSARVMLSERAARRLGLALAPGGDRWRGPAGPGSGGEIRPRRSPGSR